jgi:hypothetical protein
VVNIQDMKFTELAMLSSVALAQSHCCANIITIHQQDTSLNKASPCFTHVIAFANISFLFKARKYSIVYPLSTNGHVGFFYLLANAAVNVSVQVSVERTSNFKGSKQQINHAHTAQEFSAVYKW